MACLYIPKFATLVQVINDLNTALKMKTLRKMLLQIGRCSPHSRHTKQSHKGHSATLHTSGAEGKRREEQS